MKTIKQLTAYLDHAGGDVAIAMLFATAEHDPLDQTLTAKHAEICRIKTRQEKADSDGHDLSPTDDAPEA